MSWRTQQNPPRPSYPKEMLKHRFVPFGSLTSDAANEAVAEGMDMDDLSPSQHTPMTRKTQDGTKGSKKRKVEGSSSPRKAKRTSSAA